MKTAVNDSEQVVRPRQIRITKRIAESIRTMSTEGWIHVMQSDGKWRVRKDGAVRASGIYNNKKTAIAAARKLSHSSHTAYIIVHNTDGEVIQTIAQ